MLAVVKAVNAHVHNGQIVLDEPVDLPDGVAVKVLLPDDDLTQKNETSSRRRSMIASLSSAAASSRMLARSLASSLPGREGVHLEARCPRRRQDRCTMA